MAEAASPVAVAVSGVAEVAAVGVVEREVVMKAHRAIVFLLVLCAMAAPYNGAEAAAPSPIRATATGQTFGSEEEAVAALRTNDKLARDPKIA
jgi:hypothetical protein